jgi:hypothetical protein
MLRRQQEYDAERICFLTIAEDRFGKVMIEFEERHPLLRRPRILVTCPYATTFSEIAVAFRDAGWNETTCERWMVANGYSLARKGDLLKE